MFVHIFEIPGMLIKTTNFYLKLNACWHLSTFSKCLNEQMHIQGNVIHININHFHLISDNLIKVHNKKL